MFLRWSNFLKITTLHFFQLYLGGDDARHAGRNVRVRDSVLDDRPGLPLRAGGHGARLPAGVLQARTQNEIDPPVPRDEVQQIGQGFRVK